MKKITWLTTIPVLVAVLSSNRADAFTFNQIGDAGETNSTAQLIPQGSQQLDAISGTLMGNADVFQLYLTGGQAFSATTASVYTLTELPGIIAQAEDYNIANPTAPLAKVDTLLDPALYLFDSTGKGVYANDNSYGSAQATLSSGPGGFSPTQPGYYYLAISNSGSFPVDANGNAIFANPLQDQEVGAIDPNSLFTGFTSSTSINPVQGTPNYTIFLTGVQAAAVPESSSTLGIWGVGALGAAAFLKKQKQQQKKSKLA